MSDDSTGSLNFSNLSRPCNRKSCTICNKFIYFHQPILCCKVCHGIAHGCCLGLSNLKVFILQQFAWICNSCAINSHCVQLTCETCWTKIDIYLENFIQCKTCYLLVHKCCDINFGQCFKCSSET